MDEKGNTAGPTFRVVVETPEGPRAFVCGEDEYVWDAASRNGIRLPAICHQGLCLTCAGKLLSGSVDQRDAAQYFPEDQHAGYILLCRALPKSDLHILTGQQWEMRAFRQANGLPAPYG
ncbi:MAG: 2Fe-2S iron-sulfur cluster-binding protein [Acidobacteriaceae bacterium]